MHTVGKALNLDCAVYYIYPSLACWAKLQDNTKKKLAKQF